MIGVNAFRGWRRIVEFPKRRFSPGGRFDPIIAIGGGQTILGSGVEGQGRGATGGGQRPLPEIGLLRRSPGNWWMSSSLYGGS